MPSPSRREIIQALMRHDLSEDAAVAALRLGQELRQLTLQAVKRGRQEYAGAIDWQTGERLGPIVSGEVDGVDVGPLVNAARGRLGVAIHTHPASSAFSPPDVHLLLSQPDIGVIAAVGANGDWHILSPQLGHPLPSAARVTQAYTDARDELAPIYNAFPSLGFTKEEMWQEHSYDVWQRTAPVLGLRYDRVRATK